MGVEGGGGRGGGGVEGGLASFSGSTPQLLSHSVEKWVCGIQAEELRLSSDLTSNQKVLGSIPSWAPILLFKVSLFT